MTDRIKHLFSNFERRDKIYWFLVLVFIVGYVYVWPLREPGLVVGGDWVFPYTEQQLYSFYTGLFSNWGFRELPTGSPIPHHNLFPFEIFAGFFSLLGANGIFFQKVVISLVFFLGATAIYLALHRVCRSSFSAFMGGTAYLLSPICFNYFSIGWIFVLLFISLLPIIFILLEKYLLDGNKSALIGSCLITSLAFLQAQAVIWVSLLLVLMVVSLVVSGSMNFKKSVPRFLMALIAINATVFLLHMFWIIPTITLDNQVVAVQTVSSYDSARFNSFSASQLIRGWGSVFNAYFEGAFNSQLIAFSFFPTVMTLIIFLLKDKSYFYISTALFLVILPMILLAVSPLLSNIPFSNVFRDYNRFQVLSNFGFALATALCFAKIKSIKLRAVGLMCLLLSIHPALEGALFRLSHEQTKDVPPRFLVLPQEEIEGRLSRLAGDTNILLPTGAHISTLSDTRFKNPYAELSDIDATFSPYASGIYVSEKSSPLILNFANNFFSAATDDSAAFLLLSKLYGVDNLIIRDRLTTSLDRRLSSELFKRIPCASSLEGVRTDFSVRISCAINSPYPAVYSPNIVFKEIEKPIAELVGEDINLYEHNKVAVLGCPDAVGVASKTACDHEIKEFSSPVLEFEKLGPTSYRVKVRSIAGRYYVVLNQTFNSGWTITSEFPDLPSTFTKVLVNHLVTGWLVEPSAGVTEQTLVIEYMPNHLYSQLGYASLLIFLTLITYLFFMCRIPILGKQDAQV